MLDVLLEREVDELKLLETIAEVTNCPHLYRTEFVCTVPASDLADVYGVYDISLRAGGFKVYLSLTSNADFGEIDVVKSLAKKLETRCLMDNPTTPSPYEMRLVLPEQTVKEITLDATALDNDDWYVVSGESPLN